MRILIFIFCLSVYLNSLSQNTNITAGITFYPNDADIFTFNSIPKYKTGITFNRYTKISVYWRDDTGSDPSTTWDLKVKANDINLKGDLAGNTLPLNTIRLEALDGSGNEPLGIYCQGPKSLMNVDQNLVTGAPQGDKNDNRIDITYYIGTIIDPVDPDYNRLIGKKPDRYTVDIIFTLTQTGF